MVLAYLQHVCKRSQHYSAMRQQSICRRASETLAISVWSGTLLDQVSGTYRKFGRHASAPKLPA